MITQGREKVIWAEGCKKVNETWGLRPGPVAMGWGTVVPYANIIFVFVFVYAEPFTNKNSKFRKPKAT